MNERLFPVNRHDVMAVLSQHLGESKGIRGEDLAALLDVTQRRLRTLISEAIEQDGAAICGHPSTGYYIAKNAEELERTISFHRARALHELRKVSRLSNIPLPELLGQLTLKT